MRHLPMIFVVAALGLSGPALAQETRSLQSGGGEAQAWMDDPNIRAFYDLSARTLGPHPGQIDVDAYEAKSFVLFRAMAPKMGVTPEAMQDHLKLIPRQMVQIVHDDPKVVASFDNFIAALFGPK